MVEAPEKIWAGGFYKGHGHCTAGPQGSLFEEYIRSDIAERQIAELRAEVIALQDESAKRGNMYIERNQTAIQLAHALEAAEADKARLSEALREIIEKADYGTGAGLTADSVCEQIGTIARAALSGSGAGGWRTMESAPKDGQEFIACLPRQGGVRIIVRWAKFSKCWISKGEPVSLFDGDLWHPLPAAPTATGGR